MKLHLPCGASPIRPAVNSLARATQLPVSTRKNEGAGRGTRKRAGGSNCIDKRLLKRGGGVCRRGEKGRKVATKHAKGGKERFVSRKASKTKKWANTNRGGHAKFAMIGQTG